MTKEIIKMIYVVLCPLLLLTCERRPLLEQENNDGAFVRINIDWSGMNTKPEHLKLVFYPVDKSSPIFRYINPDGEVIQVPYGTYNIILYNWRTNNDVQNLKFEQEDNFTFFKAYTGFVKLKTFTDEVIAQPDSLCTWSSGNRVYSISTNDKKKYSSDGDAISLTDNITINTELKLMVKSYDFFIPVSNLKCIGGAEAIITGAACCNNIHDGSIQGKGNNIQVGVRPSKDGVRCHFTTFGFTQADQYTFILHLILSNGEIIKYTKDISTDIKKGVISDFSSPIEIKCPELSNGGFTDPGIEDWNDMGDNIII